MAYKKPETDDNVKRLRQALDKSEPEKVYVFYGQENYLKEHYKNRVISLAGSGPMSAFNLFVLDGASLDADGLNDAVSGVPMGAERRVVLVRDPEPSSMDQTLKDAIGDIIKDVDEQVCLVFYYSDKDFKPDKRTSFWKTLEKYACPVRFDTPGMPELCEWVGRRFSHLGKKASPSVCQRLIDVAGPDMTNLINEIEKISFGTDGGTVTAQNVDLLASRTPDVPIYEMTDRLSRKDVNGAMTALRDLFEMKMPPVSALFSIARQFQKLYFCTLSRGKSMDYLMKTLDYRSSYPVQKLMELSSRYSVKKLRRILIMCADTEKQIKSSDPSAERCLELLILRICAL